MAYPKNFYIISGCNGAGKTTASYTILPEILDCDEFVNADEIARGLSPFNPESVAIEAGKLMLRRINDLLCKDKSFSIETTLATRTYARLVDEAHDNGFRVTLLYFWLSSPELAVQRVAERKTHGGHGIPTETIVRRYGRGINNLFKIYIPLVDSWIIADNTHIPRTLIAEGGINKSTNIINAKLYESIQNHVRRGVQSAQ